MVFDMSRQVTLFIFSLFSGMLIGVVYDLYRVIRGLEEPGKIVTVIQDILFWILTGIVVFIFMMYTNYAYMNFNVFIYNGIGLFFYSKIFSKVFIFSYEKILKFFLAAVRIIFYRLSYPIRIIFHKNKKNI
ncbi:MAG: spore cortex biosynthesis protein YabQ [Clostridium sp.]